MLTADVLVLIQFHNEVWTRAGPGFDKGLYNVTDNFSLVLQKNIALEDSGKYFCEIFDWEEGQNYANNTVVEVVGKNH